LIALANEQERQEALALAARQPVDAVERYANVAARNLVVAAETAARLRVDLGSVGKDLVSVAKACLAVDRSLLQLAEERARAARASDGG
jgi:tRNA(Phe) wybutosine-synthesizing methylase Tyw3